MENITILDKIFAVRSQFHAVAAAHSDDEGFSDYVYNALYENGLLKEEEVRNDYERHTASERLLRIGIVGAVKAGKSSLLNALFFGGKDILPKAATPMTAALTELSYGEKIEITVDFFTKGDIAKLKEQKEKYDRRLSETEKKLAEEKRETWIKNQQRRNPGAVIEQPPSQESEWKEKAKAEAKRKLQNDVFLAGAAQQYEDILNAGVRPEGTKETISAESIDDIAGRLNDYVGSDGKYTPFTSKVSITLPLPELEGINIVDTPGFNDPVPSRNDRARESLKECDVILILSPARQFLSANDKDVLAKVTKKDGIRELYIIQSQIDSQLFNLEIKDEANGDLDTAIDKIVSILNGTAKENLRDINESGVFDKLIEETGIRSFPTSGLCQAMADTFSEKSSWDSGRKQLWKNLTENYPEYFSDGDESTSIECLKKLGNIDKIRKAVESVKERKLEIFKEKLALFGEKYKTAAEEAKKAIVDYIASQEKDIAEMDVKKLEEEIKSLSALYEELKPELEDVFLDTVIDWQAEVCADYKSKLSSLRGEAKTGVASSQGERPERRTEKTGLFGLIKKEHTEILTTADVNEIKNSIDDYIAEYNLNLPSYLKTHIDRLTRKVLPSAVHRKLLDKGVEASSEFRNKARAVMREMNFQYDLEYKDKSKNKKDSEIPETKMRLGFLWIPEPSFRAKGSVVERCLSEYSSRLEGDEADEYLSLAKRAVSELNRSFQAILNDAVSDVKSKCEKCNFAEQVLDGYLKQLQKKKEDIEKPKLALENFKRMKKEVEQIVCQWN